MKNTRLKPQSLRSVCCLLFIFTACRLCSAVDFLPSDQIKPGMKGIGLSVFKGTEIEEFQAEILGVLRKVNSGQDIILARLSGAGLGVGLDEYVVVAGMSGSPVYIDGKIIGAVAYAWSFQKQPIAGITPIADMLKMLNENPPQKQESVLPGGNVSDKIVATHPDLGTVEFNPIITPVVLGGFSARGEERMRKILEPYGMIPIRLGSGGAGEQSEEADNLRPGSAISVPLIMGDLSAAAIGTVTYRKDDRILAFGHPFFNAGFINMPMGGGIVYGVMPSYSRSFKLASPTRPVGSILSDRLPAIMGAYDVQSQLVPAKIEIKIPELKEPKIFNIQIIQNDLLITSLLDEAIFEAIDNAVGFMGEVTIKVNIRGSLYDYQTPYEFNDMYYSPFSAGMISIINRLDNLVYNGFQKVRLKEVEVKVDVMRELKVAAIRRITLSGTRFHPGDDVDVNVYLQRFGGGEYLKTFRLRIPQDARLGPARILVEGGEGLGAPTKVPPINFDQYFKRLQEWIPNNIISTKLIFQGDRMSMEGEELPFLPGSARGIILYGSLPGTQMVEEAVQELFATDEVIQGKTQALIMIEKEF
ncbi:MAG: hypothetical protein AB1546_09215 [bacterium]